MNSHPWLATKPALQRICQRPMDGCRSWRKPSSPCGRCRRGGWSSRKPAMVNLILHRSCQVCCAAIISIFTCLRNSSLCANDKINVNTQETDKQYIDHRLALGSPQNSLYSLYPGRPCSRPRWRLRTTRSGAWMKKISWYLTWHESVGLLTRAFYVLWKLILTL